MRHWSTVRTLFVYTDIKYKIIVAARVSTFASRENRRVTRTHTWREMANVLGTIGTSLVTISFRSGPFVRLVIYPTERNLRDAYENKFQYLFARAGISRRVTKLRRTCTKETELDDSFLRSNVRRPKRDELSRELDNSKKQRSKTQTGRIIDYEITRNIYERTWNE